MSEEGSSSMRVRVTTDTVLGDQESVHDHVTRLEVTAPQGSLRSWCLRGVLYILLTTGDEEFTLQLKGDGILEVALRSAPGWPAVMQQGGQWRIGHAVAVSELRGREQ